MTEGATSRAALREWYDRLEVRLEAGGDAAQRAALRDEVVALFRAVEREIAELAALKDSIRRLVEKWRTFAASAAAAPTRADLIGATTFLEKGWARLSVGDYEPAEAALRRALELAPGDAYAETLLAWAQMMRGEYDDAQTRLRGVLARQPTHALARMGLGYVAFRRNQVGDAIEQLWRAIHLDNDRKATLYAHYFLGLVFLERGLLADARGYFRRSLELGPNLIEAQFHLGVASWRDGDAEGAREAWRAGAAATKFNPWGRRCADMIDLVDSGGSPELALGST